MAKRAKKSTKKLGRSETISSEQLLARCKIFKWFLEENWGRIGLELQRASEPDDILQALRLVPGVEGVRPFCEEPSACLIREGAVKADSRELSVTRKQREEAIDNERLLFSKYHSAYQETGKAGAALKAIISELAPVIGLLPFAFVIIVIAKKLRTEELSTNLKLLTESYRQAQQSKQALHERLLCQEAWYARNEVVEFVRTPRYVKSPINFAKAMAGLPEYAWLYSHRKCSEIQDESLLIKSPNYRLFELTGIIMKKLKPLNLVKLGAMLEHELRKDQNRDLMFRIGPNWAYMKQALAQCRGQRLKRSEIPYRIMSGFLRNIESPKSAAEIELAKTEQLI